MSKLKIREATPHERVNYDGVYPLHGYIEVDGMVCPIEDLRGRDPEFRFEAMAPDGMIFSDNEAHSLLGSSRKDLLDRLVMGLERDKRSTMPGSRPKPWPKSSA